MQVHASAEWRRTCCVTMWRYYSSDTDHHSYNTLLQNLKRANRANIINHVNAKPNKVSRFSFIRIVISPQSAFVWLMINCFVSDLSEIWRKNTKPGAEHGPFDPPRKVFSSALGLNFWLFVFTNLSVPCINCCELTTYYKLHLLVTQKSIRCVVGTLTITKPLVRRHKISNKSLV